MTPPVRRDLPTYRELIYRPCALWPRSAGPLGEAPGAVAAIPAEAQRGLSAGQDTQEQARPCQRGVQAAAEGQGGEIARQAVQDHGHERDEDLPWQWCAPVRLSGLYHLVSDLPFFGLSRCLLRGVLAAGGNAGGLAGSQELVPCRLVRRVDVMDQPRYPAPSVLASWPDAMALGQHRVRRGRAGWAVT